MWVQFDLATAVHHVARRHEPTVADVERRSSGDIAEVVDTRDAHHRRGILLVDLTR
jgi:hypothetical protein